MENSFCVSIVLTTYNDEHTLPAVLNSLFYMGIETRKIELIIVDGGSKDGTLAIIDKFLKENRERFLNLKCIRHEVNLGVSKARNDGIRAASCPYILILDSDVVLPDNALASMISYLSSEKLKNSKIVGVVPLFDTSFPLYTRLVRDKILHFTYSATAAFLVISNVIKENLYNEELGPPYSSDEDIELGARLLKKGYEVHVMGNIIAKHLKEPTSLYITTAPSFRGKAEKLLRIIRSYFHPYTIRGFMAFFRSLPLLYKLQYIVSLIWIYELFTMPIVLFLNHFIYTAVAILLTTLLFVGMNFLMELKNVISYRLIHIMFLYAFLSLVNRSLRMFTYQLYAMKIIRSSK